MDITSVESKLSLSLRLPFRDEVYSLSATSSMAVHCQICRSSVMHHHHPSITVGPHYSRDLKQTDYQVYILGYSSHELPSNSNDIDLHTVQRVCLHPLCSSQTHRVLIIGRWLPICLGLRVHPRCAHCLSYVWYFEKYYCEYPTVSFKLFMNHTTPIVYFGTFLCGILALALFYYW